MWTRKLQENNNRHTLLLTIEQADVFDSGTYTCEVKDSGYKQCHSIAVSVLQVPHVKLNPLSISTEKVTRETFFIYTMRLLQWLSHCDVVTDIEVYCIFVMVVCEHDARLSIKVSTDLFVTRIDSSEVSHIGLLWVRMTNNSYKHVLKYILLIY